MVIIYRKSRMSSALHDHSSTTHLDSSSIIGTDMAGSQIEERTALLDSNRRVHYSGTTTPSMYAQGRLYYSLFFLLLHFKPRLLTHPLAGQDSGAGSSVFAKRIRYYIPSLAWIPNYSLSLSVFIQVSSIVMLISHHQVWWRRPCWPHRSIHAYSTISQLCDFSRETQSRYWFGTSRRSDHLST